MTGQRFGTLTVLKIHENDYVSPKGVKQIRYECLCDCGKRTVINSVSLRNGHTQSCGCRKVKLLHEASHKKTDGVQVASLRSTKRKNTSSKYKGICFYKRDGKWQAEIAVCNKSFYLGRYCSEKEAYEARKIAERILHRPFLIKEANMKKKTFLIDVVGFTKEEAMYFLESDELQKNIEKALKIINGDMNAN